MITALIFVNNYINQIHLKINSMMRILILFCVLAFTGTSLDAQPFGNRQTREVMIKTAEEQYALQDYYRALDWYEKAYDEERDDELAYKIANLHLMLRDYKKAERWWGRVVNRRVNKKNPTNPYLPDARLTYGKVLKMTGSYPDAIEELKLFINETEDPKKIAIAKNEIAGAELARKMEVSMEWTVENGGKKLNSKYSEYSPVLVNENEMYFTAMRSEKVVELDGKTSDYHAKVLASNRGEKGWEEPMEVGGVNLNREDYHTGNISLAPDGRMFLTRVKLEGNVLAESKLYWSKKSADGWSPAKEVEGVNGDYIVRQPAVGELFGNQVLFFVSDMDGGYGGYDIYYSTMTADGFAPPVNLGDVINTISDEEAPFYKEGLLYFSSDGHPSIGGMDIFSSEWNGSVFSKPENVGMPINSMVDDLYYSIDEEGYHGLLISNREGTRSVKSKTCCTDIWEFRKEKVVLNLNALTFSEQQPLPGASVQLIEMLNNTPGQTSSKTNDNANSFAYTLKSEMAYMVIATKDGFFPDTVTFNTVGLTTSTDIEKKLYLKPEPKEPEFETYTINQPIELGNIYYDYDKADILPDAEKDLNLVLELMTKYPDMVIELSSHTDARGVKVYNRKLSQRRAESAKTWLLEKGITEERIKPVGYGEDQIRNHCANGVKCSDDEHRYNRRTEFTIVAGPTSIQIEKKRLKKQTK